MAKIVCGTQSFDSVQAVLFDKDGTLANVECYLRQIGEVRWCCLCEAEPRLKMIDSASSLRAAFGLLEDGLDPAGLLAVGSRQENEVVAAAGLSALGWGWIAAVKAGSTAFGEAEKRLAPKVEKTPLLGGVADLLDRLKRCGVFVGIVSADLHSEVGAFVDFYRLSDVIWFCGSRGDRLPKTHPDFLKIACDEMTMIGRRVPIITPKNTLVIGDSASDLLLASREAAGFVAMMGGWTKPVEIDKSVASGADSLVIATVSHLSQVEVFA